MRYLSDRFVVTCYTFLQLQKCLPCFSCCVSWFYFILRLMIEIKNESALPNRKDLLQSAVFCWLVQIRSSEAQKSAASLCDHSSFCIQHPNMFGYSWLNVIPHSCPALFLLSRSKIKRQIDWCQIGLTGNGDRQEWRGWEEEKER